MPRYLKGWLSDVVENAMKREYISRTREKPILSLSQNIKMKKAVGKIAIIAEYKRSSPSLGKISDIDIVEYATFMEKSGVIGLSIITEPKYFNGSYSLVETASRIVKLPILLKDFIVTERQIDTAYNIGADAILLIAKILTERELIDLIEYSKTYGLETVVEVSNKEELEIAISAGARIIGVNARNLENFEINLENSKKILKEIPNDIIKIAESGIKSREEIEELRRAGADAFLIGTSLMREPKKIKEFLD